jgi:hypothetical protein
MRTTRTHEVWPFELDEALVQAASVDPLGELLALPARLIPDLPLAVTLSLAIEGAPARVQLTTLTRRAGVDSGHSLAEVIVFDREELRALFSAVQADRIWRKDLLGVCFDKWRKPEHRLTLDVALAGANPDEQDWPLSRVLARLGASVESFELADDATRVRELSRAA